MKTKVNQMMLTAILLLTMLSGQANITSKETILALKLENITETKLELENWMVNDNYWLKSGTQSVQGVDLVPQIQAQEEEARQEKLQELAVDAEDQFVLEPWMLKESFWIGKL